MGSALGDFREHFDKLTTILGVSDTVANVIAGEVGSTCRASRRQATWCRGAGLCPRLAASAGKHRSQRTRKSAPWLKTTLVTAAWAAI
jgi:hypothetical protein